MKQAFADFFNLSYAFRNVFLWMLLFLVGIIFRLYNYIDGTGFVSLIQNTFMALVAAQSSLHLITTVKDYMTSKNPIVVPDKSNDDIVQGDNT